MLTESVIPDVEFGSGPCEADVLRKGRAEYDSITFRHSARQCSRGRPRSQIRSSRGKGSYRHDGPSHDCSGWYKRRLSSRSRTCQNRVDGSGEGGWSPTWEDRSDTLEVLFRVLFDGGFRLVMVDLRVLTLRLFLHTLEGAVNKVIDSLSLTSGVCESARAIDGKSSWV